MAKNRNRSEEAETSETTTTEAQMSESNQATEGQTTDVSQMAGLGGADDRFAYVTDPETKQKVRRSDYIRKCWVQKKMSRGQIAKHLTALAQQENPQAKKVTYQTVFSVIKKGTAGGPDKAPEGAAA